MDGVTVLIIDGAGTDDAVLGLQGNMHALGQIGRNQGGKTDAQVNNVAVLQLLGNTSGNKALDHRLIH